MARITSVEMKIELDNGKTATATIDGDGNIFRGGDYDAMCDIVEASEDMRAALFEGSYMASDDDQDEDQDDDALDRELDNQCTGGAAFPNVPADHPVQPIEFQSAEYHDARARDALAQCGTCNRMWDDGTSTSMTPTPAGRCPFEAFHGD